jgi:hypothetical protein
MMEPQYYNEIVKIPRNRIAMAVIVVFVSIVISIAFSNYTIAFIGVIGAGAYLFATVYIDIVRNTNSVLNALLSKLYDTRGTSANLIREVEVDGVKLHLSDEDYIKFLEAKSKS